MEIKIKSIGDAAQDNDDEYFKLYNLRVSHSKIERFLKENAKIIIPLKINPLPHIEDGIITSPSANSTYFMGNCLIENIWHPMINVFDPRKAHEIKIAGIVNDTNGIESLIRKELYFGLEYPYKGEKIYQIKQNLNLRSFSFISDLEKELSTPEEIKNSNSLFEQTKNLEIIGERLSGEPEILHEIEDYFRLPESHYPVVRYQIKRILQYVPSTFPENWKSPKSFEKLDEKQKKAYEDIAKHGLQAIPCPIIQKTIELAVEYRGKYANL